MDTLRESHIGVPQEKLNVPKLSVAFWVSGVVWFWSTHESARQRVFFKSVLEWCSRKSVLSRVFFKECIPNSFPEGYPLKSTP